MSCLIIGAPGRRTLQAFSGWPQYLHLASASVVMLFAEVLAFEAIILMAGYLMQPAAQVPCMLLVLLRIAWARIGITIRTCPVTNTRVNAWRSQDSIQWLGAIRTL